MSDYKIVEMLQKIDEKLSNVIPRLAMIENRLDKLDSNVCTNLSELRSSTNDLVSNVKSSMGSLDSVSSDSFSQSSSDSQSDYNHDPTICTQGDRLGVVLSDLDESEMAGKIGQLLNCEVNHLTYGSIRDEASLFGIGLDFVVIQDSGSMLDKYEELTTDIVEEITAYVQTLVKVAANILQLKPETKVFLGSLPPRFDGRLREDLVRVFNGLLVTESFMLENVTVVSQTNLNTRDQTKLFERYEENLVVLTRYGRTLRVKNAAVQIAQAVPGLNIVRKKKSHTNHRHKGWGGGVRPNVNKKLKTVLSNFLRNL